MITRQVEIGERVEWSTCKGRRRRGTVEALAVRGGAGQPLHTVAVVRLDGGALIERDPGTLYPTS